jgi:transcriptional regulator with XRE-family HTH domain
MGIGDRIKRVRKAKGVTVAAIAAAADVSKQAVYQWESGETAGLAGSNLVAVAKILDVSVEWLDTGKGRQGSFQETGAVPPPDISPEALQVARTWQQLSPGRRAHYQEEMAWVKFFESKFPTYRIGIANMASHDKFERSVEADWARMMRQQALFPEDAE